MAYFGHFKANYEIKRNDGSYIKVKDNGETETSGNLNVTGTINCDTSLTLDSTTITTAKIGVLDGVDAGTATPSKALILDANKDIGTIRNLTLDGAINLGSDASGDMYYRNSSGVLARIAVGSDNQVLTLDGAVPGWEDATGGGGSVSGNTFAADLKIGRDADNHIDFATTDNEISLHTNGNERMVILSNGKVGIGTSSPSQKLHVNGVTQTKTLKIKDDSATGWTIYDDQWGLSFYNGSSGNTWRARINNSLNVSDLDFTGQHKNLMNSNINTSKIGLIVSTTNNYINLDNSIIPNINESLPYCVLSNTNNDKKVFGVISNKEDNENTREYSSGNFISIFEKQNANEQRFYINSLGEGAIWVCDKNENLENGDYITSTTVTGYGGKQILEPNRLMNYTVAKITCDCDFSLTKIPKQKLKTQTVTETLQRNVYEDVTETIEKTEINFDETLNRYVQTIVTEDVTTSQIAKDTHDLYDNEGNIIGTHQTDRVESYDVTKNEIDYDANGDPQYEDDLDENGGQQMVYKYETRFLASDGTQLVDEADYNTRKANNENVYIACFVGCTYHCG